MQVQKIGQTLDKRQQQMAQVQYNLELIRQLLLEVGVAQTILINSV